VVDCRVKWYYAVGDQPVGPVSRAELEALYEAGTITTATMVLQEGMYDWVPFVDLKKTTQFLPCIGEKPKARTEKVGEADNEAKVPEESKV
jgi:GYF domain 2